MCTRDFSEIVGTSCLFIVTGMSTLMLSAVPAEATPVYWNLFNIEEENQQNAVYITYASLTDMLNDTNRAGSFIPDTTGASAENVVGSGSDGTTYWNLFNIEEENQQNAVYITYASLVDMLNDTNRAGSFIPDTTGASAQNVVGGGSDGTTYWNLFNIEEENQQNAVYITYASLVDMLNDTNRTGSFIPDTTGASAQNVVGSGAFVISRIAVPEPVTLSLFGIGLACLGVASRRRKRSDRGSTHAPHVSRVVRLISGGER
jgi:hypothetical protein